MIVLDTHAWLWWLAEPQRLSPAASEAIDRTDRIGVSAISAWELVMLAERGRIRLDREPALWVAQGLAHPRLTELPVTADIAVRAALLDREGFGGDPADRLIYATADAAGAQLITKDERLRGYDPRRTVW